MPCNAVLYNFSLGYDHASNVNSFHDSVIGAWNLGYDNLSRLVSATGTSGSFNGINVSTAVQGWTYDSFGNRKPQAVGAANQTPTHYANYPAATNHMANNDLAPGGVTYDANGRLSYDGSNHYLYEAQGWLCGVKTVAGGIYQYYYDASGNMTTYASRPNFTCYTGTTTISDYLYDQAGRQLTAVDGSGKWLYTNVFANGELLATYDNADQKIHYALSDWLGDKRVQLSPTGPGTAGTPNLTVEENCWNLPFNDASGCSGSGADISNLHYTGKPHDANTLLDLFGARNYTNFSGRFMSPDYWGTNDGPPDPLPYGDPSDPQSLNLYSYVRNNPLSQTDSDGHDCIYSNGDGTGSVKSGDCYSDTDSGIFVDGTVNANSFSYNAANNSSSFSYTTDSGGLGTGVIQGPDLNGGFDAGSLAAGVFGAGSASTWNNAYGVTSTAFNAELTAAGFAFPLEHLAVTLLSGSSPSGVQQAAGGIRNKPGSLGQFGDNVRENKIARDIIKELKLTGKNAEAVHDIIGEASVMEGRQLGYRELVEVVKGALGLL